MRSSAGKHTMFKTCLLSVFNIVHKNLATESYKVYLPYFSLLPTGGALHCKTYQKDNGYELNPCSFYQVNTLPNYSSFIIYKFLYSNIPIGRKASGEGGCGSSCMTLFIHMKCLFFIRDEPNTHNPAPIKFAPDLANRPKICAKHF